MRYNIINNIILFCTLSNLLNCHITNTPMIYVKNHKIKITVLSLFIISLIYSATQSRQSTETIQAKIEETVSSSNTEIMTMNETLENSRLLSLNAYNEKYIIQILLMLRKLPFCIRSEILKYLDNFYLHHT